MFILGSIYRRARIRKAIRVSCVDRDEERGIIAEGVPHVDTARVCVCTHLDQVCRQSIEPKSKLVWVSEVPK